MKSLLDIRNLRNPTDFGNYVRAKRLECGITQIEFAEKVCLSQTGLSLIESGKNDPKLTTVIKIEKAFKSIAIIPAREINFKDWKSLEVDRRQIALRCRGKRADRIKRKPRDPDKVEIFSRLAKQAWDENIRIVGPREFEFKRDIFEN